MKNILKFLIFNSWFMILLAFNNELNLFKVEVEEENRSVFPAIFDVIFELFVRRGVLFEIVIFGQISGHANDVVTEVLKKFEGTRPTSIFKYDSFTHLDESAVIFFDWNLTKSKNFSFDLNFKQSSKFLFLVESGNYDLMQFAKNPDAYIGHLSQHSYFFVNNGAQIDLKSFEWWTQTTCNKTQLVTLNTFNKNILEWKEELQIPDKFLDFHGCILKTYSHIFTILMVDFMRNEGMTFLHPGIPILLAKIELKEMSIVKIFAERGNFSIFRPDVLDPGFYNDPDIFTKNRKDPFTFHQKSFSLRDLAYFRLEENKILFDCSSVFYQFTGIVMYSPPEPYTNYEKMVLPFDPTTWMYLALVFGCAFLMIFIMNLLPPVFKEIFYGKNIKMPSFNVIGTFFGIGKREELISTRFIKNLLYRSNKTAVQ